MRGYKLVVSATLLLFSGAAVSANWMQIGPTKNDGYATEFEIDTDRIERNGARRVYHLRVKGAGSGTARAVDCAAKTMSYKTAPYSAVDIEKTNEFYKAAFQYVCRQ